MNGKNVYFLKELEKACYGLLKNTSTGKIDLHELTIRLEDLLMLCTLAIKETDREDDGGEYPPKGLQKYPSPMGNGCHR